MTKDEIQELKNSESFTNIKHCLSGLKTPLINVDKKSIANPLLFEKPNQEFKTMCSIDKRLEKIEKNTKNPILKTAILSVICGAISGVIVLLISMVI